MLFLAGVDGLNCKSVLFVTQYVNSTTHLTCAAPANDLLFLRGVVGTCMCRVSILTRLSIMLGSDSLLMPFWLTTRSIIGNFTAEFSLCKVNVTTRKTHLELPLRS